MSNPTRECVCGNRKHVGPGWYPIDPNCSLHGEPTMAHLSGGWAHYWKMVGDHLAAKRGRRRKFG